MALTAIIAKELELRGSFRFHPEFGIGVGLMLKGLIDVEHPVIHQMPCMSPKAAFGRRWTGTMP